MSARLRDQIRRLGLGRLIYNVWHGPLGRRDQRRRYGSDFLERVRRGEEEMRQAVASLPPTPRVASQPQLACPVHVLTGANYWHQTAFCLHSLQSALGEGLPVVRVHSDGALKDEHRATLRALAPGAVFDNDEAIVGHLDRCLPISEFPVLRAQRGELVLMRKILDALAGEQGYHLFIDSDVLFWKEPTELIAAVADNQTTHLHEGNGESYCLPRAKLELELAMKLPEAVNSGLIGLDAGLIDWPLLERAAGVMAGRGNRRILEQSLWGFAIAEQCPRALSVGDYKLCTYPENVAALRARPYGKFPAMVHYAWHARYPYFENEWKLYLKKCGVSAPEAVRFGC